MPRSWSNGPFVHVAHYVRLLLPFCLISEACHVLHAPVNLQESKIWGITYHLTVFFCIYPSFHVKSREPSPQRTREYARTEVGCREGELGSRDLWWTNRGHAKSQCLGRPNSKYLRISNDRQTTHCLGCSSSRRTRYRCLFIFRARHCGQRRWKQKTESESR